MRKVFLDIETTGLMPEKDKDRIIEIGMVYFDDDNYQNPKEYYQLINPERKVSREAFDIHGLGDKLLSTQPLFKDVADDVLKVLTDATVYAHNAEFDVSFLNFELGMLHKTTVNEVAKEIVDTYDVARKIYVGKHNSLNALAKRAGINVSERRQKHGALIDAKLLVQVYLFITQNQSSLDLKEDEIKAKVKIPKRAEIKLQTFTVSKDALVKHEEYLQEMFAKSEVKPLLMK